MNNGGFEPCERNNGLRYAASAATNKTNANIAFSPGSNHFIAPQLQHNSPSKLNPFHTMNF